MKKILIVAAVLLSFSACKKPPIPVKPVFNAAARPASRKPPYIILFYKMEITNQKNMPFYKYSFQVKGSYIDTGSYITYSNDKLTEAQVLREWGF